MHDAGLKVSHNPERADLFPAQLVEEFIRNMSHILRRSDCTVDHEGTGSKSESVLHSTYGMSAFTSCRYRS